MSGTHRSPLTLTAPIPGAVGQPRKPNGYHHGQKVVRDRRVNLDARKFIAWDGEGVNLKGAGRPQSYVLFGSSENCILSEYGLSTFDCLDHIIETGARNPESVHIGFAFSYDSNMIVKGLSPSSLARLHRNGWVRVTNERGEKYTITFAKGKYFRVTKYHATYDAAKNPHAKTTVQIFDIFSFFACSFIKAYEDMVGPIPDVIRTGKRARGGFTIADLNEIKDYWSVEIVLLKALAEALRKRVYNAGLRISQWHGPGALASYAMRNHGIKAHMAICPTEVREAARYGYAGGRFELYKVGRLQGTIYGVDINSAYPHAIAQLPSLKDGEWRHVENPHRIVKFGIYRVRIRSMGGFERAPGPLFHRDREHNISFPWFTDGWYFSPEAAISKRVGATIIEGWEYVGSSAHPFSWVSEVYETRQDWKRRGISAQLALKLLLNSIYGKLAQRVGWNEVTKRLPPFHQLEWAGWVTSYVRARLFNVMMGIPFNELIAVETDGIYTTTDPQTLGITDSHDLGGWEVTRYQEVLYVQSGLAWLHHQEGCHCDKCDDGWEAKRRGLDGCREGHSPELCDCAGTFSLNACRDYLSGLHAVPTKDNQWQAYKGQTTRFLGLGQALASSIPTAMRHCVWETAPRDMIPGYGGKRIHIHTMCDACQGGATAWEMAHDLVIHSRSVLDPHSYPHSIPWEPEEGHAMWRDYQESHDGDVTLQYV